MVALSKTELVQIRLVNQPSFTGNFGNYAFTEGVSEPMLRREAERLSAVTTVQFINAPDLWERKAIERGIVFGKTDEPVEEAPVVESPKKEIAPENDHRYTRVQLEAIADKDGIEGLREIGAGLGVKAVSVQKLIFGIMEAQKNV